MGFNYAQYGWPDLNSISGDVTVLLPMKRFFEVTSISYMGGSGHLAVGYILVVVSLAIIGWVAVPVFRARLSGERGGPRRGILAALLEVADTFLIYLASIVALCVVICMCSLRRGKGEIYIVAPVVKPPTEWNLREGYSTGVGDNFVPALLLGTLASAIIAVTLYTRRRWAGIAGESNPGISDTTKEKRGGEAANAIAIRRRVHQLDLFKYIAMFGIIIGCFAQYDDALYEGSVTHAKQPAGSLSAAMWLFGNSFIVAGFALVSGYNAALSVSELNARRVRNVFKLGLVLLMWQMVYVWFFYYPFTDAAKANFKGDWARFVIANNPRSAYFINGIGFKEYYELVLRDPFWTLWYIRALFVWSLLVPFWLRFRYPVTAAAIISALSTFAMGDATAFGMKLPYTLNYFPFFVFGASVRYYGSDKWLLPLSRTNKIQWAARAVIITTAAFAFLCPFSTYEWALYATNDYAYHCTAAPRWWHAIGRLAYMGWSLTNVCAWISVLSDQPSYFASAGQYTIVPAILQYPIALLFLSTRMWGGKSDRGDSYQQELNTSKFMKGSFGNGRFWLMLFFASLTANILMCPFVGWYLRWIVKPPMDWMFLDTAAEDGEKKRAVSSAKRSSHESETVGGADEKEGLSPIDLDATSLDKKRGGDVKKRY